MSVVHDCECDESEDEFDLESYEAAPQDIERLNIDLRTERAVNPNADPFEPPRSLLPNTQDRAGPKGVLADFDKAQRALIAKKRMTAMRFERTTRTQKRIGDDVDIAAADDDDEFAGIYARCRDKQSLSAALKTAEVDQFVVVHVYSNDVPNCLRLHLSFEALAERFTHVRFLRAAAADVMPKFDVRGLPALLVYRNGSQIESALRVTDVLPADFADIDVARLLQTKNILVPTATNNNTSSSSSISSTASTRPSTGNAHTAALSDDEDVDDDSDSDR